MGCIRIEWKPCLRSMLLEDDYAEPARVRGACPQDVIVLDFFTNIFFVAQTRHSYKSYKRPSYQFAGP